jgi:hypothetical protein
LTLSPVQGHIISMAQRIDIDPVLVALQRAPIVPLTDEEKCLLAEVDAEPEQRIPHAEVARKLHARAGAA